MMPNTMSPMLYNTIARTLYPSRASRYAVLRTLDTYSFSCSGKYMGDGAKWGLWIKMMCKQTQKLLPMY